MKLSDKVDWEYEALQYAEVILQRIRNEISDKSKEKCYKNNQAKINKAVVLSVLHDLKLYQFTDPED